MYGRHLCVNGNAHSQGDDVFVNNDVRDMVSKITGTFVHSIVCSDVHQIMHYSSPPIVLCKGNPPVTGGFPSQWPSNVKNVMTSKWDITCTCKKAHTTSTPPILYVQLVIINCFGNIWCTHCPACRTSLIATRFWVVVICPIIKCLTVLEFSFILFVCVYSSQFSILFWIMYLL